ncbi:MAG: 2-C-methyl-D-erythritol 4-phosphate cytidylyltransferase [Candidatus Omnitrophica bacterium]|nr:2-C-methyl-D-erythritol 4-phosphate cytidylyltransferase [Candidatus Omnitrophota bacterium]
MKIVAIILAGGRGTRIGTEVPKQFLKVVGKSMIIHCLELYDKIKEVDEIYLSVNERFQKKCQALLGKHKIKKLIKVVPGGKVRQDTIRNAFHEITGADRIVIQNAVSPTVSEILVGKCIKASKRNNVVTAYLPAFHTVFERYPSRIKKVLKRKSLGYACDPQVFQTRVLEDIFKKVRKGLSGDIPMLESTMRLGHKVHLVESEPENIKTTFWHDVSAIESVLRMRKNSSE